MKQLMLYRQINQRRMSAFYLSPQHGSEAKPFSQDQLVLDTHVPTEDRPRSLREMFADIEYDNEDDGL
ncbi:hypothetical protein [Paralcaligenes ginsengisoli]